MFSIGKRWLHCLDDVYWWRPSHVHLHFFFFLTLLTLFLCLEVFCTSLWFLRWAPPNLFLIRKPPCLRICLKSARHTAKINHTLFYLCLCMSLCSLYVGENKTPSEHVQDYHHLHGDCLLHLLLFLSPLLSLSLSLSLWVICGVRSAAPTHSSPVPVTKSEFWNCKRSNKQDWLQLFLLIAAPMCSHDL